MDFKPSDFLISLFEFFSVILPGAVFTYFLAVELRDYEPISKYLNLFALEGAAKWVAFIFCAYLFGHILFALGAAVDRFYDKQKFIKKKRAKKYDLPYLTARYLREKYMNGLFEEVINDSHSKAIFKQREYMKNFEQEIREEAQKEGWKIEDKKVLKSLFLDKNEIENAYKFTKALMTLKYPAAAHDITYLESNQKFFRTLFVALLLISAILSIEFITYLIMGNYSPGILLAIVILLPLAFVCFWRYATQRYKSTELAYQLLIAHETLTNEGSTSEK